MAADFREIAKLSADLRQAGADVAERAATVVAKTAHDIAGTAQDIVPVDTSATKNSIGVDLEAGGLAADIGPTTHYSIYLEYGTSRMAPHAFMGPAADRHEPDFFRAMEQVADPNL